MQQKMPSSGSQSSSSGLISSKKTNQIQAPQLYGHGITKYNDKYVRKIASTTSNTKITTNSNVSISSHIRISPRFDSISFSSTSTSLPIFINQVSNLPISTSTDVTDAGARSARTLNQINIINAADSDSAARIQSLNDVEIRVRLEKAREMDRLRREQVKEQLRRQKERDMQLLQLSAIHVDTSSTSYNYAFDDVSFKSTSFSKYRREKVRSNSVPKPNTTPLSLRSTASRAPSSSSRDISPRNSRAIHALNASSSSLLSSSSANKIGVMIVPRSHIRYDGIVSTSHIAFKDSVFDESFSHNEENSSSIHVSTSDVNKQRTTVSTEKVNKTEGLSEAAVSSTIPKTNVRKSSSSSKSKHEGVIDRAKSLVDQLREQEKRKRLEKGKLYIEEKRKRDQQALTEIKQKEDEDRAKRSEKLQSLHQTTKQVARNPSPEVARAKLHLTRTDYLSEQSTQDDDIPVTNLDTSIYVRASHTNTQRQGQGKEKSDSSHAVYPSINSMKHNQPTVKNRSHQDVDVDQVNLVNSDDDDDLAEVLNFHTNNSFLSSSYDNSAKVYRDSDSPLRRRDRHLLRSSDRHLSSSSSSYLKVVSSRSQKHVNRGQYQSNKVIQNQASITQLSTDKRERAQSVRATTPTLAVRRSRSLTPPAFYSPSRRQSATIFSYAGSSQHIHLPISSTKSNHVRSSSDGARIALPRWSYDDNFDETVADRGHLQQTASYSYSVNKPSVSIMQSTGTQHENLNIANNELVSKPTSSQYDSQHHSEVAISEVGKNIQYVQGMMQNIDKMMTSLRIQASELEQHIDLRESVTLPNSPHIKSPKSVRKVDESTGTDKYDTNKNNINRTKSPAVSPKVSSYSSKSPVLSPKTSSRASKSPTISPKTLTYIPMSKNSKIRSDSKKLPSFDDALRNNHMDNHYRQSRHSFEFSEDSNHSIDSMGDGVDHELVALVRRINQSNNDSALSSISIPVGSYVADNLFKLQHTQDEENDDDSRYVNEHGEHRLASVLAVDLCKTETSHLKSKGSAIKPVITTSDSPLRMSQSSIRSSDDSGRYWDRLISVPLDERVGKQITPVRIDQLSDSVKHTLQHAINEESLVVADLPLSARDKHSFTIMALPNMPTHVASSAATLPPVPSSRDQGRAQVETISSVNDLKRAFLREMIAQDSLHEQTIEVTKLEQEANSHVLQSRAIQQLVDAQVIRDRKEQEQRDSISREMQGIRAIIANIQQHQRSAKTTSPAKSTKSVLVQTMTTQVKSPNNVKSGGHNEVFGGRSGVEVVNDRVSTLRRLLDTKTHLHSQSEIESLDLKQRSEEEISNIEDTGDLKMPSVSSDTQPSDTIKSSDVIVDLERSIDERKSRIDKLRDHIYTLRRSREKLEDLRMKADEQIQLRQTEEILLQEVNEELTLLQSEKREMKTRQIKIQESERLSPEYQLQKKLFQSVDQSVISLRSLTRDTGIQGDPLAWSVESLTLSQYTHEEKVVEEDDDEENNYSHDKSINDDNNIHIPQESTAYVSREIVPVKEYASNGYYEDDVDDNDDYDDEVNVSMSTVIHTESYTSPEDIVTETIENKQSQLLKPLNDSDEYEDDGFDLVEDLSRSQSLLSVPDELLVSIISRASLTSSPDQLMTDSIHEQEIEEENDNYYDDDKPISIDPEYSLIVESISESVAESLVEETIRVVIQDSYSKVFIESDMIESDAEIEEEILEPVSVEEINEATQHITVDSARSITSINTQEDSISDANSESSVNNKDKVDDSFYQPIAVRSDRRSTLFKSNATPFSRKERDVPMQRVEKSAVPDTDSETQQVMESKQESVASIESEVVTEELSEMLDETKVQVPKSIEPLNLETETFSAANQTSTSVQLDPTVPQIEEHSTHTEGSNLSESTDENQVQDDSLDEPQHGDRVSPPIDRQKSPPFFPTVTMLTPALGKSLHSSSSMKQGLDSLYDFDPTDMPADSLSIVTSPTKLLPLSLTSPAASPVIDGSKKESESVLPSPISPSLRQSGVNTSPIKIAPVSPTTIAPVITADHTDIKDVLAPSVPLLETVETSLANIPFQGAVEKMVDSTYNGLFIDIPDDVSGIDKIVCIRVNEILQALHCSRYQHMYLLPKEFQISLPTSFPNRFLAENLPLTENTLRAEVHRQLEAGERRYAAVSKGQKHVLEMVRVPTLDQYFDHLNRRVMELLVEGLPPTITTENEGTDNLAEEEPMDDTADDTVGDTLGDVVDGILVAGSSDVVKTVENKSLTDGSYESEEFEAPMSCTSSNGDVYAGDEYEPLGSQDLQPELEPVIEEVIEEVIAEELEDEQYSENNES